MAPARRVARLARQLAPEGVSASDFGLKVTRLGAALGAQVEGLDCKKPLTPELVREINRLWAEADGILIFKKQSLTEKELMDFSANFGHVLQHPFVNGNNDRYNKYNSKDGEIYKNYSEQDVMTIGSESRADTWHTDMTWMQHPPKATFLQCATLGEDMRTGGMFTNGSRGDTMFASMIGAYNLLSPGLQKQLEGMTCQHAVHDLMRNMKEARDEWPNGLGVMSKVENQHPAVIVHPVSGKKVMYVNNWPCKRFTGMSQEETAPLKRYLNEVATQQKNTYRHSWSEGDMVMIDQRCTMHYVFPDYDTKTSTRVMQRTTITDGDGTAPGSYNQPRPVGVTGHTGQEMAAQNDVHDAGGTPTSYRANVTLLRGSYTKSGGQPYSDVPYDESNHVVHGGMTR